MGQFLGVCLGSAVGGGMRYLLSIWTLKVFGASFPVGTLAVNLIGSFLLAVFMFIGSETTLLSPALRVALTTGLMGGFTTYSTFSFETMKYIQLGAWGIALGNVVLTVTSCLAACFLGWALAKAVLA